MTYWQRYSAFEDELRRRFHQHPICDKMRDWSDHKFQYYLIQIGFIAQNFVKWYEVAKLALDDERAKEVVRAILRDEIPQSGPTHQDNRLHDLQLMGVTKQQLLSAKPSPESKAAVDQLFLLVRPSQDFNDLRILVALRVAGEVLVAEQYDPIVREMYRRFEVFYANPSLFYEPHREHDRKGGLEKGHTAMFDEVLASFLVDEASLEDAMVQAQVAFNIRYGMQDQFLPPRRIPHVTHLG